MNLCPPTLAENLQAVARNLIKLQAQGGRLGGMLSLVEMASLMGLINIPGPQCSKNKMEIEGGWDRAEQERWTGGGGEGVADRCGQFFSDSFKKKFKYCRLHFFNFEDSKPGPISGEKKGVWYRAEQGRWTLGEGGGGGSIWPLDLGGPGAVDLSLVWGIKICQLHDHFQSLCSLKQQR